MAEAFALLRGSPFLPAVASRLTQGLRTKAAIRLTAPLVYPELWIYNHDGRYFLLSPNPPATPAASSPFFTRPDYDAFVSEYEQRRRDAYAQYSSTADHVDQVFWGSYDPD